MTPRMKQLLVAASPLFAFAVTAFGLSALLGLRGADAWILRGGLIALGGASSAVMYWFMRTARGAGQSGSASTATASGQDVEAAFAAARTQLASSRTASTNLATLPAVVVLGPSGSAKTTSVMRSGLDAELLAGGVLSGETIVPTPGVNLWFGRDALVIEAGGSILADSARWSSVLRHLRPSRLAALVRARAQAPRAAVVCIGCDRLLEAGGADASMTTARLLRERLGELSRMLGTRLPVYVVFTKLDRVPFFADWVRGFTKDDASEVLGATLAGDLAAPVGSYADRETARLNEAFEHVFRALASRRPDVLAREYALEHRGAAYEFPREFRKLAAPAVSFLVEMCRPNQLQVSPFLRGFYFTGVQAVLVSDAAPAPVRAAAPQARSATGHGVGATSVGEQPARGAAALPSPALTPATPAVRKVPRWVFLDRLFPEVVLGDAPALDITRGGAGAEQVRRIGLAAAVALGAVVTLGLLVSFLGNRRLESRTLADARAIAALPAAQLDLPSADQLRLLDALRGRLDTLAMWERESAPLRLGFGLYSGSSLIAAASRVWFGGFERLMFDETRAALLRSVRAFPDTVRPTDDYAAHYDLLKAYLITTAHQDQSDPAFLTPVLMRQWLGGRELDGERNQLALRQFDHYGAALPAARPFADSADARAVAGARRYLLQFADIAPIYRSMVAEASSRAAAVQFNRLVPGSAALVVNAHEVPGAFTREGWAAMQDALANVDRYYQAEAWVLGEAPDLPNDRAKLAADLRARYVAEYIDEWRDFLAAGSITRYTDLRDAARKLAAASGNQSPLLGMLAIAARHTAVDSSIAAAFQPVHLVTPPTLEGSYLTDGNKPYVDALIALQSAVAQTAAAPTVMEDQAASQAGAAASSARIAARTLAQGFVSGDAAVGTSVLRLLEDPIARVESHLAVAGTGGVNVAARRFCSIVRPLLAKVPFSPRGRVHASVDEVTRFFRPGTGELWRFYESAAFRVVEQQGEEWGPKALESGTVSPAFLRFFNQAAAFSATLFPDNSSELRLQLEVTPRTNDVTPMVSITVDGESAISGSNMVQRRMVWTGQGANDARLEARIGGAPIRQLLSFEGRWAMFQLFQAADRWVRDGDGYRVEWDFSGQGAQGGNVTVTAHVVLRGANVLARDFFSGASCAGDIVR